MSRKGTTINCVDYIVSAYNKPDARNVIFPNQSPKRSS